MSETLSLKRLYMYTAKHWFESRKQYGLFFLALSVLMAGWFAFLIITGNPNLFNGENQMVIYFAGLFIAGCLSAAFIFNNLSAKAKKISYYMLPASAAEKLLCVLFYGVVLFFLCYSVIFYITDFFAIKVANSTISDMMNSKSLNAIQWRQQEGLYKFVPAKPVNVFKPAISDFIYYPGDSAEIFAAFFPIQSAFLLGSVYFTKNSLFKTIVALLAIFMLFVLVESKLLAPLFPRESENFNAFSTIRTYDAAGNATIYSLPFWIGNIASTFIKFAITPIIWVAIYYRLKENEI